MIEYNLLADAELFICLKEGDYSAYTEIYQRYGGILFVFIERRIDDRNNAEGILVELFVDLWDKREDIEIISLLSTFLYISLRYKMINFLKCNANQKRFFGDIETFKDQTHEVTHPLEREKQLAAVIEAHVDELPQQMKEVFLSSRKLN